MHYFEHHIGDYDSATAHLSLIEDGVFSRLLRVYYRTEQALPACEKQISRLIRACSKVERDAVCAMLAEFFELQDDGWHNRRADEQIARFRDKQAKAKRSAEARWNADRPQCDGNAEASDESMRTNCGSNADGMHRTPVPTPQSPITRESGRATSSTTVDRGSRLPKDWTLPGEWQAWAEAERRDLDAIATAARFKDFWLAKPGKDGVKLDWFATWRNWCRSEKPLPSQGVSPSDSCRPLLHADDDLRIEVAR